MPASPPNFNASSTIMFTLSLLTIVALASASPQSIVFVNNSINEPAFDSFIQIDAFSTAPPKILDNKVQSTFQPISSPACFHVSLFSNEVQARLRFCYLTHTSDIIVFRLRERWHCV